MRVAVRVDATPEMGTGHVQRCLTLGTALTRAGASVTFLSRHLPEALSDLIAAGGMANARLPARPRAVATHATGPAAWLGTTPAVDADDTEAALGDGPWDWLVIDHYALDARFEERFRESTRLLVVDDLADRDHVADLLLDANIDPAGESRYRPRVPPACRLLLGPRYALLRDEFVRARASSGPRTGPVSRVLVCFGGVDLANHTARALEALAELPPFPGGVDVVVGAGHADREGIARRCEKAGHRLHVQTAELASLMAGADLAIGAGGTTTWERCALGLPALVVSVAENQAAQVRHAAVAGLVFAPDPGEWERSPSFHLRALLANAGLRESLSQSGLGAVDGRGAARVLRAMGVGDVTVRAAVATDSASIFSWRGAAAVRAVSRAREPLNRASHDAWLARVLADPDRVLLVGERAGEPVGVVRFDVAGDVAEVSIYLTPGTHAPGTGIALLAAAERHLALRRTDVLRLRAVVLTDNRRSHGLFRESGYSRSATSYEKEIRGQS